MIKIVMTMMLVLMSHLALAKMVVTGKTCGMKESAATNNEANLNPSKQSFPLKGYAVDVFFICDLQYAPSTPKDQRQFDLKTFNTLEATGQLQLVSYDKEKGAYQYQLVMQPFNINNGVVDGVRKYQKLKGKAISMDGKPYLTIEGHASFEQPLPILHTALHLGSDYFRLERDKNAHPPAALNMMLTRLKDFPVTMEIEIDKTYPAFSG